MATAWVKERACARFTVNMNAYDWQKWTTAFTVSRTAVDFLSGYFNMYSTFYFEPQRSIIYLKYSSLLEKYI